MLKNPKITADTNILISSFACVSAVTVKIIDLAEEGLCEMAVSEEIILEFQRVAGVKFGWDEEKNRAIEDVLKRLCRVVSPRERIKAVKQDPDDNMILECAVEAGSDYIITGDRHLLCMHEYRGIKIISPAEFIRLMI